jgi:hypothetical protein
LSPRATFCWFDNFFRPITNTAGARLLKSV